MIRRLPSLQALRPCRKQPLPLLVFLLASTGALAQQPWIANQLDGNEGPTTFEGEALTGRPDREVRLQRNVEIRRGPTVVNADDMNYDVVDDRVDAKGNVRVLRQGNRFQGDELRLKLDTGVGYMRSPVYRLMQRNAQGYAERIDFESEDIATINNGVYTTCNGPDPDWYLKTGKLTLDDSTGIGVARNAMLVFKGVPIAGTPRISFPLGEQRKSGFLAPTFLSSTNTGLQLSVPYYWDIAPNRDVTLRPRFMATRGLMLGADVRYLERDLAGETRFEFMNDDQRAGDLRYGLSMRHNQRFDSGVALAADFNRASDDNYARDFPLSHVFLRPGFNRRLLPQTATLSYGSGPWGGSLQFSDFQVLQDPLARIGIPYSRLPQLNLSYAQYTDTGLELTMGTQYTRFMHPTQVQGDRLVVNPRVTYTELQGPGYFFRPSFSVHGTVYSLDRVIDPAMSSPTRVLPTFTADTGLIFERDTSFLGRNAIQTLEPRAFYTYTPYVAQNSNLYPNFDSTIADFSYAQIFRENRFVGNDRIGDANQLTLALSSRYLESNGAERLRLAVAQRFNLTPPKVGLGTALQDMGDARSDVLLLASGRVTRETRLDASFQYNQVRGDINRVSFGVYWQPAPMKVVNAQYRRDSRNLPDIPNTNFELIDVSSQWPLTSRWYGVGRLNYLLDQKRIGQSLAGVEYQADCWIFRMVSQRLPTAAGVVNTTFFIQLEFNGLSALGMNPMRALRGNIPGYQPLTQPQ
jgi:LPS-assembly protein